LCFAKPAVPDALNENEFYSYFFNEIKVAQPFKNKVRCESAE